ncbi:glycosyltransferase family 2 protein [Hugonella massiliensis]|uniref:glycosyltransferase family 2 protein n=1 Tax=Hugonella massiliensis TaxID=1720315 RepID=UPI00073E78C7|nr:glycosyltransferase family 2 protein [Hugonella massiliensis]
MAKLSVIVPVYNVEDCLDECLASLRSQTFGDIEIVCVNDGSTDRSREVLARCQDQDERITVVNQANKGLSGARNTGISMSTGEYVCFLDSDDKFEPNACERIVEELDKFGTEVVVFGAGTFPEATTDPWMKQVLSPRDARYNTFQPDLLFKESSTPYVWRVALKRSALDRTGLAFDESLKFGEDQLFLFSLYPQARGVQLVPDKLYLYRLSRSGSLMDDATADDARKVEKNLAITRAVFQYWAGHGLMNRWPAPLLNWSVKFELYSILCQERSARDAMAKELVQVWRDYVSDFGTCLKQLPGHAESLASVAVKMADSPTFPSEREIKSAMVRYRMKEYGTQNFVKGVVRKLV